MSSTESFEMTDIFGTLALGEFHQNLFCYTTQLFNSIPMKD